MPVVALRPFVACLWASHPSATPPASDARRERVLPTGSTHIVFRLGGSGLRVYDDAARAVRRFGPAAIGGPRVSAYCKWVDADGPSVGAMLHPGVAEPLTGTPMLELAGTHSNLDELWPSGLVTSLVAQLGELPTAAARVDLLEHTLLRHVEPRAARDPLVAYALRELGARSTVGAIVAASGFSHRHLGRRFTAAVGMTPKTWSRLQRFDAVLAALSAGVGPRWTEIAAYAGYSDQAHLVREFREFAGITPGEYCRRQTRALRHVPEP